MKTLITALALMLALCEVNTAHSQITLPCVTTEEVPDMIGLTFAEAQIKWHDAGFLGPMFPNRCCSEKLIVADQSIPVGATARCYTPIGLIMVPR